MLVKMALRNIRRNKRRSFLAVLSVTLALALVVVLQGLVEGMVDNMVKNGTKNDTGHIRITSRLYAENIRYYPVQYLVTEPEALRDEILKNEAWAKHITLITFRVRFPVLLQYEGNNKAAFGLGGDIGVEKDLLMLEKAIVDGRYLSGQVIEKDGHKYREVIVGKKMADILKIGVGDSFSVMLQGSDYGVRIPRFQVVGIFQTGLNMMDENIFQLSLDDARDILRTSGGVQEVLIFLKDYKKAPSLAKEIQAWLDKTEYWSDAVALSWNRAGGIVSAMEQILPIYNLIYFVVTFLGMLIITNIMMMIVLERRREIGLLKAMGMKSREILGLFLYEGLILGLLGSVFGVLLGLLISWPLSVWGLDFSSSLSNMNLPLDPVIRWKITAKSIVTSLGLGLFVAVIVSVIPSRLAARMRPVDAIRSV
ncbi:ABC transporter permease [Thermospira aquatica]|uniref:ABC transporter permease n=1 Tax=Thermospira aquatica TaxID=2828656 RepID=A0AAX3BC39_9SPIR|nr:FtsX-like permease family protein [Thermospira aquatica]URA09887.1 ABC transporter permease [Thermospira aquatica]